MTQAQLIKRIEALENQVHGLQKQLAGAPRAVSKTYRDYIGMFSGDQDFLDAMKLGAEYRRAQRPKTAKRKRAK
jgi:hypothetical protein